MWKHDSTNKIESDPENQLDFPKDMFSIQGFKNRIPLLVLHVQNF